MLSTLLEIVSLTLGLIDLSYYLLIRLLGENRPKFFSAGWGEHVEAIQAQEDMVESLRKQSSEKNFDKGINIVWGERIGHDGDISVTEGRFPSPIAHRLPEIAKQCHFFFVEPSAKKNEQNATKDGDFSSAPDVLVLMLPATGEASKRARLSMASRLANEHGWSSVIVTAPFYGARKPSGQNMWFIERVDDFLFQSQAIMLEGAALVKYFVEQSPATRVCVTGFSWGAAMSACTTSIALLTGCDGERLACVPYVGSATPAVLPDGILKSSIDWEALKQNQDQPISDVRQQLCSTFIKFNLDEVTALVEEKRLEAGGTWKFSLGSLKVVAMQHDHIIRHSWAKDLIAQMNRLTSSATTKYPAQWLPGGHVMAALYKHRAQTAAIVEAVEGLKKKKL